MRSTRLALLTLALGSLAACSAPPNTGASTSPSTNTPFVPDNPTAYGPGDYCADTYVLIQATTRANFSLGSEYYRNGDTCAAYPYIKHILATEPMFTGEDPDDRNYLRMAAIYEDFAANVDSTNQAEQIAYLDSALASRRMGVEALNRDGIAFDSYLRDLREGFFYFQNSSLYEDAEVKQFEAFTRAFQAKPDSLEDWYLTRLFAGSADEYGDEIPNPERATYIRQIASAVDDASLRDNYTQFATYIETEPSVQDVVANTDEAVQSLLDDYNASTLRGNRVFTLLATAQQQPERLVALGADPEDVISGITRLPEIVDQVDSPRLLYALSVRARREGDSSRANELFGRAITNAESNAQRADFYYSAGQYDRALQVFPSHGPSLYRRAGLVAQSVGRPSSVTGRFAYWCLADLYRNVAAQTSGSIASNARTTASRFERAGPSRDQYFLAGYSPGQSVTASLGAYGSCSTRVR